MAYSRWGGSDWYVFWLADTDDDTETPKLAMWHVTDDSHPVATFDELDGVDEDRLAKLVPRAPRDSIAELMEYVQDFCADVRDMRAGGEPTRW